MTEEEKNTLIKKLENLKFVDLNKRNYDVAEYTNNIIDNCIDVIKNMSIKEEHKETNYEHYKEKFDEIVKNTYDESDLFDEIKYQLDFRIKETNAEYIVDILKGVLS